ncbi:MAG: hypothetical protein JW820_12215, partial [Spirochaetales bacterium]|nr:hypothetical protein [Spirochaetales bacterium]
MAEASSRQFILLPMQGIRMTGPGDEASRDEASRDGASGDGASGLAAATGRFFRSLTHRPGPARAVRLGARPAVELRLLDSVSQYGAKLVEIA